MNQDDIKQQVAHKAVEYVLPHLNESMILGIGTGSTANFFIDLIAEHKSKFAGTVASSEASSERLSALGVTVKDLNDVETIAFYIDGADECNASLELIKGGGGALTREKIVASASDKFICIADDSKWVKTLGAFPLPLEVVPMARALVTRSIASMGGNATPRKDFITDNGNIILDVNGLDMSHPVELETALATLPGVLCSGLFALRPADVLLLGNECGVDIIDH